MVLGKLPLLVDDCLLRSDPVTALDSGAVLAWDDKEGAVMEGVAEGGSSLVGKREGSGRGALTLDVDATCDEG
jgi:hypothetical protein